MQNKRFTRTLSYRGVDVDLDVDRRAGRQAEAVSDGVHLKNHWIYRMKWGRQHCLEERTDKFKTIEMHGKGVHCRKITSPSRENPNDTKEGQEGPPPAWIQQQQKTRDKQLRHFLHHAPGRRASRPPRGGTRRPPRPSSRPRRRRIGGRAAPGRRCHCRGSGPRPAGPCHTSGGSACPPGRRPVPCRGGRGGATCPLRWGASPFLKAEVNHRVTWTL